MIFLLVMIYIAFISLGLPDALLGSAWPNMHVEMGVPVSYAGVISMIISGGTILSSLGSDGLTKKMGTGKVTAVSVAVTAAALWGFSVTKSFWVLCLIALPYGLGAGAVDAALNNYVAVHFKARHMSWLHCFWGIGATMGPYIMGACLSRGIGWNYGYRSISVIQIVLTAALFATLPLWKKTGSRSEQVQAEERKGVGIRELFRLPGAKAALLSFFCYSALEQTTGLWASSFMVMSRGISAETAAAWASLFYLGITAGRLLAGFATIKFSDTAMIRLGQLAAACGIVCLLVPAGNGMLFVGLILVGIGCAPIYPSLLHETPVNFGEEYSQAIMGMQMACAYVGTMVMPPFFGIVSDGIGIGIYPVYLAVILAVMFVTAGKLPAAAIKKNRT